MTRCYTVHRGPVGLFRTAGFAGEMGSQVQMDTPNDGTGGGNSALVTMTSPKEFDALGNPIIWQGIQMMLLGRVGPVWVGLRRCWAPAYAAGGNARAMLQYQGAAVDQFRLLAWLTKSGFGRTSQWADQVDDVSFDMSWGSTGNAGGVAPGASFFLTGRTGVLPVGSDFPQVSAMPERRRLTVELLATTGLTVGCAWNPLDATPAAWIPLQTNTPRVFDTTAPLWIAADPPGSPTDIAITEELA